MPPVVFRLRTNEASGCAGRSFETMGAKKKVPTKAEAPEEEPPKKRGKAAAAAAKATAAAKAAAPAKAATPAAAVAPGTVVGAGGAGAAEAEAAGAGAGPLLGRQMGKPAAVKAGPPEPPAAVRAPAASSAASSGAAPVPQPGSVGPSAGPSVKAESIPQAEYKRMIYSLKAMASKGKPGPLDHFSKLGMHERRSWYWNTYRLDPSCSDFAMSEVTQTDRTEEQEGIRGWMTKERIMDLNNYRNQQDPKWAVLAEALTRNLPSREHADADLARAGERQYYYVWQPDETTERNKISQQTAVAGTAVLAKEDGQAAMDAMLGGGHASTGASSSSNSRRALPPQKQRPQLPEPAEWMQQYKQQYSATTRAQKAMQQKVSEAEQLLVRLETKLEADGGNPVVLGYQAELTRLFGIYQGVQKKTNQAIARYPGIPDDESEAQEYTQALSTHKNEMDMHTKSFSKLLSNISSYMA